MASEWVNFPDCDVCGVRAQFCGLCWRCDMLKPDETPIPFYEHNRHVNYLLPPGVTTGDVKNWRTELPEVEKLCLD